MTNAIKVVGTVVLTAGLAIGLMTGCSDAHAQQGEPVHVDNTIQTYTITEVSNGTIIGENDTKHGVILYQNDGFPVIDVSEVGDEIEVTYGKAHDDIVGVEWAR